MHMTFSQQTGLDNTRTLSDVQARARMPAVKHAYLDLIFLMAESAEQEQSGRLEVEQVHVAATKCIAN